MFESHAAIDDAARLLREAQASFQPCQPIRGNFPEDDIKSAYAIQLANVELAVGAGRRVVGRKIGLTSPVVQAQLGVDQPDFGTLFAHMAFAEGVELPFGQLIAPRCEAEVALVLEKDLDRENHTVIDIMNATAYALPALEIVDSRVADWDIRITDTIADNGSSGLFVVGSQPVSLAEVNLPEIEMVMTRNGEVVSQGLGSACLGNPLNAAAWLADTLSAFGTPLKAGDVVLTGSLGPVVKIEAGDSFRAEFGALGNVTTSFST